MKVCFLGLVALEIVAQAMGGLLLVTPVLQVQEGILLGQSRNTSACCEGDGIISCTPVDIDVSTLGGESIELPGGIEVTFRNTVGDNQNAYHYGGEDGSDLIVTYNPNTEGLEGHATSSEGKSYAIEFCGTTNGHVLKELDVENLSDSLAVDYLSFQNKVENQNFNSGADMDTMVTYTVKFYYTAKFAQYTADIDGFIDQMISETNQGYSDSGVKLTVAKHCSELATIEEEYSDDFEYAVELIEKFEKMKSSVADLRGSADAAVLLVTNYPVCGLAWFDGIHDGRTFSVVKKDCAVGKYSFGHEVGHNIGLDHNVESSVNEVYSSGQGHYIEQGSASADNSYRTIMGVWSKEHKTRVNVYSNPAETFEETGTALGVKGVSNNVALLNLKRFSLAAVGDESLSCEYGCSSGNTYPQLPKAYIRHGFTKAEQCRAYCERLGQHWTYRNKKCYVYDKLEHKSVTGWTSGLKNCSSTVETEVPDCFQEIKTDSMTKVVIVKKQKGVGSAPDCHKLCQAEKVCSHWAWRDHTRPGKKECRLLKVGNATKRKSSSGTKNCRKSPE